MNISDALGEMGLDFHMKLDKKGFAPMHAHWYLEFVYVLEGKANHIWNGEERILSPGDFFVIGHLSQHAYTAVTPSFQIMNVMFNPVFLDPSLVGAKTFYEVLESSAINLDINLFLQKPTPYIYRDTSGSVRQLLLQMEDEYKKQEPGYFSVIRGLFIQILICGARQIYGNFQTRSQHDAFSGVLQYIHYQYMNPITLEDLCAIINYSAPYMSKKFKATVGLSFSEYLRQLRILTSQRLLRNSGKSIDQIMGEVGYQDKKTFYAAFRKLTGTTPDAYRRTHRTQNAGKEAITYAD